ncbi:DUF805 domain-containing protein [Curtobacterium flaccumfaciens]|nr:DUF805 domain-containing protein [Curtobacterium flaccumfaciens]
MPSSGGGRCGGRSSPRRSTSCTASDSSRRRRRCRARRKRVLDQAMQSFNPFPVWWFLLTSMPAFAQIALGVFVVVGLAALLPWIAIAVRRLHDTNRSGWWVLLYFVPAGYIALAVFLALPSEPPAAPQQSGPPVGDRPAHPVVTPQ